MKKLSIVFVLLLSAASYAKEIPSPFWFSISEKILTETHFLINPDAKEIAVKPVKKMVKPAKVKSPLKCQDKTETFLQLPFYSISSSGIWQIQE